MYEYSLTSLINKTKGRVRAQRMRTSSKFEILISPRNSPDRRISDLTFHESQHILHKERLVLALNMLNLSPAKTAEYMRKIDNEYHDRTGKFEDDIRWLSKQVNLSLLTTKRRPKHVTSKRNDDVRS
jgi:hypothetical protein